MRPHCERLISGQWRLVGLPTASSSSAGSGRGSAEPLLFHSWPAAECALVRKLYPSSHLRAPPELGCGCAACSKLMSWLSSAPDCPHDVSSPDLDFGAVGFDDRMHIMNAVDSLGGDAASYSFHDGGIGGSEKLVVHRSPLLLARLLRASTESSQSSSRRGGK